MKFNFAIFVLCWSSNSKILCILFFRYRGLGNLLQQEGRTGIFEEEQERLLDGRLFQKDTENSKGNVDYLKENRISKIENEA